MSRSKIWMLVSKNLCSSWTFCAWPYNLESCAVLCKKIWRLVFFWRSSKFHQLYLINPESALQGTYRRRNNAGKCHSPHIKFLNKCPDKVLISDSWFMDCGENFGTDLKRIIHINCKKLKTTFKQKLVVYQDKEVCHVSKNIFSRREG